MFQNIGILDRSQKQTYPRVIEMKINLLQEFDVYFVEAIVILINEDKIYSSCWRWQSKH